MKVDSAPSALQATTLHLPGAVPRAITFRAVGARNNLRVLFEPVGNAAAGEIVRRHFHADAVANKNANTVLPHLAGHCRQHNVLGVIQLNFEECVGLFVDDSAFRWNQIVSGQ